MDAAHTPLSAEPWNGHSVDVGDLCAVLALGHEGEMEGRRERKEEES